MTQRKNVQQSTMAFATSCRHRRRKRVIRWKSCLWTLFQFNQSLPFSRKIHFELTLPFLYKNSVKSTLCWIEIRFHGKSKTVKNYAKSHHLSLALIYTKKLNTFWRKFLTSSFKLSAFQLSRPWNVIFFNRQNYKSIHTFR